MRADTLEEAVMLWSSKVYYIMDNMMRSSGDSGVIKNSAPRTLRQILKSSKISHYSEINAIVHSYQM